MKKIIKMYHHSDKEDNYRRGQEIGLEDEALDNFCYALYEVEFEVEVDMEKGEAKILSFKQ